MHIYHVLNRERKHHSSVLCCACPLEVYGRKCVEKHWMVLIVLGLMTLQVEITVTEIGSLIVPHSLGRNFSVAEAVMGLSELSDKICLRKRCSSVEGSLVMLVSNQNSEEKNVEGT